MRRLLDRLRSYRYTVVAILCLTLTLSLCGRP